VWIGIVITILAALAAVFAVDSIFGSQSFVGRLKKEMPDWVEKGWLEASAGEHILASVGGHKKRGVSTAFAILGVLLFGSGVITFFASNWDEISKLVKLIILFVSMWAVFAAALWSHFRASYAWLSEPMLLLGVILFGVNIMLIAQIYHIDSHYPDGVFVWGLGALLVAWLMKSKSAFVASVLLVLLWTGMEAFDFKAFHWQFMLVWGIQILLLIRCDWRGMLHFLAVSFLFWAVSSYFSLLQISSNSNIVYLMQNYFIFYLILFLLGMHLSLKTATESYGEIMQRYAAVAALGCFYILTFPDFLQCKHWGAGSYGLRSPADNLWLWITAELLLVLIYLALWHRKRTLQQHTRQAYHIWGMGLLGAMLLVMLVNMAPLDANPLIAVMFNLVYFSMLIWLIFFGMRTGNSHLVNISFLFFGITLLSRYFDTFWGLLDRSLFFMAGGVVLIVLGVILEKKRRSVMTGIADEQGVSS